MNCTNCGFPLTPGATSCPNCKIQFSQAVPGGFVQPTTQKAKVPVWAWVVGGCSLVGCLPVIAIVAAILFPVFALAREKARTVTCATNEKQIDLGLQQYVQDYDTKLPPAGVWNDAIVKYIGTPTIKCPTAETDDSGSGGYAFNSTLSKKRSSSIPSPATMVVIFDSSNLERNATDPVISAPNPGRHRDRQGPSNNYLFLDGHVELLTSPPAT